MSRHTRSKYAIAADYPRGSLSLLAIGTSSNSNTLWREQFSYIVFHSFHNVPQMFASGLLDCKEEKKQTPGHIPHKHNRLLAISSL